MRFKKALITITASIALIDICPAIINSQKVEAKTQYNDKAFSKYARKFHRVLITKRTQVYKVHRGYDEAHNRYTKAYVLKPGDFATIRDRGIAWGWTIGKSYNYCSMRDPFYFDWFDTYTKHTYIDTGLFHGAKKRTEKSYDFSWSQYCKLVKMGLWDLPTHPNRNKKINQQIKKWNLQAE